MKYGDFIKYGFWPLALSAAFFPISQAVATLFSVLTLLIGVPFLLRERNRDLKIYGMILVLFLAHGIWASGIHGLNETFRALWQPLFGLSLIPLIKKPAHLHRIVQIFIWCSILSAIIWFLFGFWDVPLKNDAEIRYGLIKARPVATTQLVFAAFAALAYRRYGPFLFLSLAMLSMGARTAQIMWLTGMLVVLCFHPCRTASRMFLIASVILCLGAGNLLQSGGLTRWTSMLTSPNSVTNTTAGQPEEAKKPLGDVLARPTLGTWHIQDFSTVHRLLLWKMAINEWLEKPILGWGYGAFYFTYDKVPVEYHYLVTGKVVDLRGKTEEEYRRLYPEVSGPQHAHSNYLDILHATGIVGFFLLFAYYGAWFLRLRSYLSVQSPAATAAFLILITAAVGGVLEKISTTSMEALPLWLFLGLAAVEHRLMRMAPSAR